MLFVKLYQTRPKYSPMHLAANGNKIDMLAVLLKHDQSLGYFISKEGALFFVSPHLNAM